MNKELQVGDAAPQFKAMVIGGDFAEPTPVSLSQFKGRQVVLYFYPKDSTPGCTTQACALRDDWAQLRDKALILGVSVDSIVSHQKFISKYELPFALLSDEQKDIVSAYGVWVEKSMYGKKYMGAERSTFVIGPDQKIKAIFRKVKPAEHVQWLQDVL